MIHARYEIHVVRDADTLDLPLPAAFDAFDCTTLVSWTDSSENARRIAASEGTGLPHGCVVIDVVEGSIDFGDRVVRIGGGA